MTPRDQKLFLEMLQALEHSITHFKHQHVLNRETSELMTLELGQTIKAAKARLNDLGLGS
jgi:hypothetical protein